MKYWHSAEVTPNKIKSQTWSTIFTNNRTQLQQKEIKESGHSQLHYLHCLGLKFSVLKRWDTSFSSLFELIDGLIASPFK